MATHAWNDESPASRAFSALHSSWASPSAMLSTNELAHDLHNPFAPTTPEGMVFPLDDVLADQASQPVPLPRSGVLDWEHESMATYTHFDQLGFDDSDLDPRGNFYLSDPNSFSGSPGSWGPGFNIDPPQTPDSPALTGDSFGISPGLAAPFSPPAPLISSLPNEHPFTVGQPRTRSSARIPARRTNTHSHSFSSQLRGSSAHSPPSRPSLHMRAMSHSAAMLTRPTNLLMSPRTLRNNTLDAALAHTDAPIHFHHVLATPYSSSAPSRPPAPIAAAGKSRRSSTPEQDLVESAGEEDPSRKRKHSPEVERAADIAPPLRSRLHPPKQAPSTWQIFFTEYLQNYKSTNPERKLNVSQAAKDGGAAYKALSSEQKEIYKRKARFAKDEYERELASWQRTLTPEDIRTENAYRAAQRKAGKSRRSNLKDPNAPKKPLSAYFMFLQWIRADPSRVIEVFSDETETTRQSVLAAAKWRTLSDAEKKPFLAQAEREKLDYEAARKDYEERTTGISNPNLYTGGGYMRINTSSASSGWHHTSADTDADNLDHDFGGRRSSSSKGKLAGGAAFGALMFAPNSVFDEDSAEPNDTDDVFAIHQWKTE